MSTGRQLAGRVCIVTGATRGIGKGIAVQLALQGAKVYITGRTFDPPVVGVRGCLRDTAQEIQAMGGECIAVQCDHSKDDEIERLFDQVNRENDGQLDILVNNAFSAVSAIFKEKQVTFWNQPIDMWDHVNHVGLRNHYICSVYAARLMVPQKKGLIVNISSPGGLRYTLSCAYGIGKEACDRMAADCAHESRKENVAFVSLWPGPVGTETLKTILGDSVRDGDSAREVSEAMKLSQILEQCETPMFSGKCIAALATDPNIMRKSGTIQMTADLGREYGLTDENGHTPVNFRQINDVLRYLGYTRTAWFVPNFIRIPKWMFCLLGSKF